MTVTTDVTDLCDEAAALDADEQIDKRRTSSLLRWAAKEIERLEADLTTRTKAARHVACMLGGAGDGDQSSGAWTRDDLRKLFKCVCAEYPWMDPRNQEAAEAKGGE